MSRLVCLLLVAATLAGCGRIPTPSLPRLEATRPSEPLPYKARLLADRGAADFAVAVEAPGVPLEATRETVRFHGTRHCLRYFGSSRIVWDAPVGAPDTWTATLTDTGAPVYSGRCVGR